MAGRDDHAFGDRKEEMSDPDVKDYLAIIAAMFETTLLPAILLIVVLAVVGILISLAFRLMGPIATP